MSDLRMTSLEEKNHEARLRRLAKRYDLALQKSRVWRPHLDNVGRYRLIDPYRNNVILGVRYELYLDDVEAYLSE